MKSGLMLFEVGVVKGIGFFHFKIIRYILALWLNTSSLPVKANEIILYNFLSWTCSRTLWEPKISSNYLINKNVFFGNITLFLSSQKIYKINNRCCSIDLFLSVKIVLVKNRVFLIGFFYFFVLLPHLYSSIFYKTSFDQILSSYHIFTSY